MKLSKSIQKQIAKAEEIEQTIKRENKIRPRAGRPSTKTTDIKYPVYVEDSEKELAEILSIHNKVIGSRTRGNKRIGNEAYYADLIKAFKKLKKLGITLPKNKSLSRYAIPHGLGEVLRNYGLTNMSDDGLMKNGTERQKIIDSQNNIFERVAKEISYKTPP